MSEMWGDDHRPRWQQVQRRHALSVRERTFVLVGLAGVQCSGDTETHREGLGHGQDQDH